MLSVYRKWLAVPAVLVLVGALITVYSVNNPTDRIVAGYLTYDKVVQALGEHLLLVLFSMIGAIAIGVLVGIMLSRPGFYVAGKVVEGIVNVGQTIPSLAVLALFLSIIGLGFRTAVFALFLYSILPILRNTFAGIVNVDSSIVESARGMGMTPFRILTRIELPIAYPIIASGIRTAIVINVGAATLATFIGGGGFGELIVTGLSLQRNMIILTGAALAALMAIILDYLVGRLEAYLVRWS